LRDIDDVLRAMSHCHYTNHYDVTATSTIADCAPPERKTRVIIMLMRVVDMRVMSE